LKPAKCFVICLVMISLMFTLTGCGSSDTPETKQGSKEVTISKAEFDQIKSGMSYEEVKAIIGGEGEVMSESGNPGDQFYTVAYMYKGKGDLGANANFMFQTDKLQNKAQFGLK